MIVQLTRGLSMQCDREVYLRFYLVTGGASLWAGSNGKYAAFRFERKMYLFHRWIMNCTDPKMDVSHIDGNTFNNYLYNLEIVTRTWNKCNLNDKLYKNNLSGARGITWNTKSQKWCVQIRQNNINRYLGLFDNFDDAVAARQKADCKYNFTQKV